MSQMEIPEDPRFAADSAAPAAGQASSSGDGPRRSWFSRNWLWFVPTAIALPTCLCGGLCGGIIFVTFQAMKSSEPYRMTIEAVTNNLAVIQQLGEPVVDATVFPMGSVNVQNDEGDANFIIKVRGPKGEAEVSSRAMRQNGQWRLTYLQVMFLANNESITLIENNGAAGEMQVPVPLQ